MKTLQTIDEEIALMDNRYIRNFFNVYDKAYYPTSSDFETRKEKVQRGFGFIPSFFDKWFPKYCNVEVNVGLEEAMNLAYESLITDPTNITIKVIEDFCDFVRICEKVIFYKNEVGNEFVVDSSIEDKKKRIIICKNGFNIKIETSHPPISTQTRKEEFYFNGRDEDITADVINIEVEREFGKKIRNSFVVVNRDMKFQDSSDLYLINTINLILQQTFNHFYRDVLIYVENKNVAGGNFNLLCDC